MTKQITITVAEYNCLMDIVDAAGTLWMTVNKELDPTQSLIKTREHCLEWLENHSMELKTVWEESDAPIRGLVRVNPSQN